MLMTPQFFQEEKKITKTVGLILVGGTKAKGVSKAPKKATETKGMVEKTMLVAKETEKMDEARVEAEETTMDLKIQFLFMVCILDLIKLKIIVFSF